MRTLNLDPFWRSSVGFDRLFDLADQSHRFEPEDHYPAFNINRTGENAYRISVAVAGFSDDEISIEAHRNVLTIKGERKEESEEEGKELLSLIERRVVPDRHHDPQRSLAVDRIHDDPATPVDQPELRRLLGDIRELLQVRMGALAQTRAVMPPEHHRL